MGGLTGFAMQYYGMAINYPLNIGGRPLNGVPSFIPITFELTVLFAAFAGVIGLLVINRLPQFYHPVFTVKRFERASQDRFFLCVEARDPKFNLNDTRFLLEGLRAKFVTEVKEEA